LKKKLLYNNININNPFYRVSENNKISQNTLYESLIIFVKNLNYKFIFDLFQIKLENEEEKQKFFLERNYNSIDTVKTKKFEALTEEFKEQRANIENVLLDYDKRSKLYINPEVLYQIKKGIPGKLSELQRIL
jgi:hypothetical protein